MEKSRLTFLALVTAAIFRGVFGLFVPATSLYDGITGRQDKIDKLKLEQMDQTLRAARLLKEKKQVDRVKATALPGNLNLATNIYSRFLVQLLLKHKFDYKSFTNQSHVSTVGGARGQASPFITV